MCLNAFGVPDRRWKMENEDGKWKSLRGMTLARITGSFSACHPKSHPNLSREFPESPYTISNRLLRPLSRPPASFDVAPGDPPAGVDSDAASQAADEEGGHETELLTERPADGAADVDADEDQKFHFGLEKHE
jgi:hypothetical protein